MSRGSPDLQPRRANLCDIKTSYKFRNFSPNNEYNSEGRNNLLECRAIHICVCRSGSCTMNILEIPHTPPDMRHGVRSNRGLSTGRVTLRIFLFHWNRGWSGIFAAHQVQEHKLRNCCRSRKLKNIKVIDCCSTWLRSSSWHSNSWPCENPLYVSFIITHTCFLTTMQLTLRPNSNERNSRYHIWVDNKMSRWRSLSNCIFLEQLQKFDRFPLYLNLNCFQVPPNSSLCFIYSLRAVPINFFILLLSVLQPWNIFQYTSNSFDKNLCSVHAHDSTNLEPVSVDCLTVANQSRNWVVRSSELAWKFRRCKLCAVKSFRNANTFDITHVPVSMAERQKRKIANF